MITGASLSRDSVIPTRESLSSAWLPLHTERIERAGCSLAIDRESGSTVRFIEQASHRSQMLSIASTV
jgi:hypothetical protein